MLKTFSLSRPPTRVLISGEATAMDRAIATTMAVVVVTIKVSLAASSTPQGSQETIITPDS